LFLGTDAGLYMSLDMGKKWQHMNEGFPSVQVSDLKIHPREHDLVIGTFGRALWILDDIRPLRKLASEGVSILEKELMLFESPVAYHASRRSYDGIRFNAQGEFVGDNKSVGYGKVNVWTKPGEDIKKETEVKVFVKNTKGDTIRTLTRKIKGGYDQISWNLDEDGIQFPRRKEPKKDADLPGGVDVMPGDYKLIVKMEDHVDSAMVTVKIDPRSEMGVSDFKAKVDAQKDYQKTITSATEGFNRIVRAKNTIKKVKGMMDNQEKEIKTEVDSLHKLLNVELDSLENLYMMPEGLKGIQRNPNTLMGKLFSGAGYLRGSWGKPGANAINAVSHAQNVTKTTVKAINNFIETKWKPYEARIKEIQLIIFEGNIDEVKME
jgi:hypothetical protein